MVKIATSGGYVFCSTNKNIFSSNRSLEDDAIAKTLLFEDSNNDLIPSDSGLSESYTEYVQKRKGQSNQVVLLKMQCLCPSRKTITFNLCFVKILFCYLQ